jgi:hypothetical protein
MGLVQIVRKDVRGKEMRLARELRAGKKRAGSKDCRKKS